ncbi:MAG: peroxide stress protein YaaA [Candidatus Protistobacter heckmanni]|nr:peroxide stress protein YaaA [Candidatus Protistobacter heckmanni]
MLIVLSPAKSLDYTSPLPKAPHTLPDFIDDSAALVEQLRKLSPAQIGTLMSISDGLSVLNANRFASWSPEFSAENSRQAVLAFDGDVYDGLKARELSAKGLEFAQQHVRILSGLYGVLKPLDWMQPYRLEMGTRLPNARGKDLYAYWGERVTAALNAVLAKRKHQVLVNLASNEYFKAVKPPLLRGRVVTPVFEDWSVNARGASYKIVSFFAKKARGLMTRYVVDHRIQDPEKLKGFDSEGYRFAPAASSDDTWVFRRKQA